MEAGKVLLPERVGWLDDHLDELSKFPSSAYDDYFDSTTQALNYLREMTGYDSLMGFYALHAPA